MLNSSLWKSLIQKCLREMSDLSYQQKVWLGQEKSKVSSFTELICKLYDDYDFLGFINLISQDTHLNDLTIKLKDLDQKIKGFLKSSASEKKDSDIIIDTSWITIAHHAKEVLEILKTIETPLFSA